MCCYTWDFAKDNAYAIAHRKKIAEMRRLIGLETLEESTQKMFFKFKGSPFLFTQYYSGGRKDYVISNINDLNKLLEGMKKIEFMIIIICSERDYSTDIICSWLNHSYLQIPTSGGLHLSAGK